MLDRRRFLATLPALAAASMSSRLLAAPMPELVLHGPPAGPSIVGAQAVESGALAPIAERAAFRVWRSPDEIRAGFASGRAVAAIVPTNVAANLYNRGAGVRLVNVMTSGLLFIVGTDPERDTLGKLAGRKLAVPFRNDMPDHVLTTIARAEGVDLARDLVIEYAGSPPEAMQLLLAGRVDAALLAEPSASAAILQSTRAGKRVVRTINMQAAWARATNGPPVIPQAGLAVSATFVERDGARLAPLHAALANSADWVRANPASAGRLAAAYFELPAPVVERSIPYSNLVVRTARIARPDIETLFRALAQRDAATIGGKLPDDGFYAI